MIPGRLGYPESGRNLKFLLAVAAFLILATCTLKPENEEPLASFTIEPSVGTTDTVFVFDASECSDPDEETRFLQVRWDWDGDGIWDTLWGAGKQRTHRYESIGSYVAGLQVRDSWGEIGFCTCDVLVGEVMHYPVAVLTVSPSMGTRDTLFTFDASASIPSVGEPASLCYRWDWEGDGSWDVDWTAEAVRTHQYAQNGIYPTVVEVRNIEAVTDTAMFNVTVFGPGDLPIATFTVTPPSGTVSTDFHLDASGCSDAQDPPEDLQVRWDWTSDGVWDTDWTTQKTAIHRFRESGDLHVLLAVQDTNGFIVTTERIVTVTNTTPVAVLTVTPLGGPVGTEFVFDASESTDAEEPTPDLLVRWDWEGDGVWDLGPGTEKTVHRTIWLDGTYHTVIEVFDVIGTSDTSAVDVVVTNTSPTASFTVSDTVGSIATQFLFDATGSIDAETPNLFLRWDWEGDGVWDRSNVTVRTSTHTYPQLGIYHPTLEVKDNVGLADTTEVTITILNTPPRASLWIGPAQGRLETVFSLDASGSNDLEDGSSTFLYRWDFETDDTWDIEWSNTPSTTHQYPALGAYKVTVMVKDSGGLEAQATAIANVCPDLLWRAGGGSVNSSPVLSPAEDAVYVGGGYRLYSISPSGTELWRYTTAGYVQSTPAVGTDGTIYVASNDGTLHAVDPAGSGIWAVGIPGLDFASPVIAVDGTIYMVSGDSRLYAVNPDGSLKWRCYLGSPGRYATPAIGADGTIYVVTEDNVLHAVGSDSTLSWSQSLGAESQSTPAIGASGNIYVGSVSGLHAFQPDGTPLWMTLLDNRGIASPSVGPGEIIYINGRQWTYAIDQNGYQVWAAWADDSYDDYCSTPTIGADGLIYVNGNNYLIAIRIDGRRAWIRESLWGAYMVGTATITSTGILIQAASSYGLHAVQTTSLGLADSAWPKFKRDAQGTGHR